MNFDPRVTPARDDIACEGLREQIKAVEYRKPQECQINTALLGVFEAPSPDAQMVTQALYGEKIQVYDRQGEWLWGQLQRDGYVGYMPAGAITDCLFTPTHHVVVPVTFSYPQASIKSSPADPVYLGAQLSVVGTEGEFARVRGGRYVRLQHLRTLDKFSLDPVDTALLFLHAPYLWGGKSWAGLDCSGLVQIALQAAGRNCPRDSDMIESQIGRAIETRDLQRGDLVFWKGHVGLMTDEQNIIHANGHTMQVTLEPLQIAVDRIARLYGTITSARRFLG